MDKHQCQNVNEEAMAWTEVPQWKKTTACPWWWRHFGCLNTGIIYPVMQYDIQQQQQ